MKNKNEPNSSFKFGFLLVTLGRNVANGLATKRSLIMQFGRCGGCGGVYVTKMVKTDHPQGKHHKLLKNPIRKLHFDPVLIVERSGDSVKQVRDRNEEMFCFKNRFSPLHRIFILKKRFECSIR